MLLCLINNRIRIRRTSSSFSSSFLLLEKWSRFLLARVKDQRKRATRARIPKREGHAEVKEAKRSEKSRANRLCSNLTFRNQRKSEVVLWIFRIRFLCVCVCGRGRGHEAVQFVYEKGIAHKGRNACPDLRKFDG